MNVLIVDRNVVDRNARPLAGTFSVRPKESLAWRSSSRCPNWIRDPFLSLNHSGAAWEEAFLEVIGRVEDQGKFRHISTARFASRTLELELEANTKTVVPYFASTFIIMGLFSVVTCMMTDWVRSKPWLGLLGNISAAIATIAAFGLCMYLGIDFIGINLAAPFLMIGKSPISRYHRESEDLSLCPCVNRSGWMFCFIYTSFVPT